MNSISIRKWRGWQIAVVIIVFILVVLAGVLIPFTTSYSSQVIAVEAGGSIGINPSTDRIDFGDMPSGTSVAKAVTLESGGDSSASIRIFIIGGIGSLIKVEPSTSFKMEPGESQQVIFRLSMPATAVPGTKFSGRIFILRLPGGFW